MRVVFDTSVLVAAARSRQGASFALISSIPAPEFQLCLSAEDARRFLRYLASQAHLQEIHFLWRPFLRDADDDMVLELAFAAGCRYIVTHNVRDFHGSGQLGAAALSPREYLNLIRKKA